MIDKEELERFSKAIAEKQRKHQAERDAVKGDNLVFIIEPYEQQALNVWIKEHYQKCELKQRALTYSFTNTGIGIHTSVKCTCGSEIDITDYESW